MIDFNDAPRQSALVVINPDDWERQLERLRVELKQRAESLIRDIFPRARIHRGEARIGNVQGDAGESLAITLTGDQAGLWHDHSTGEGGDLIDLWRATHAHDFRAAVEQLEQWCGIGTGPKWNSPVAKIGKARAEQAAKEPKVDTWLPTPTASWHYYSPDGAVLAIIRRYDLDSIDPITGKRKKTFRPFTASGEAKMPDPRPLYRLPQINSASTVVLVEGEKCADALERVGIEATTAMGGAKADPAKTDWTPLAGKTVLVWEDNDEAGSGLCKAVTPYLEAIGCTVRRIGIPAGKPPKWDAADAVDEGEDIDAILKADAPSSGRKRLPILSRSELRAIEPPDYLIEETIAERSVIALYGPSGSLKSFVAIDMAMSVAHGLEWHGKPTKQGAVVYVTGEGTSSIGQRFDAWDIHHDRAGVDAPIYLLPFGVPVSDPEWVTALIEDIAARCGSPAMVWLDTLARTFGSGDENSQKDMNAFITGVDRLRDELGCVVGIVHHTGKDGDRGLRGSSALYAAMDTVIKTDRKNDVVTLKNQQPHGKQKDGAEFDDIAFKHRIITLGEDRKGRKLSSLALVLDDTPPAEKVEKPSKNTASGSTQLAVMDVLKKADEDGLGLTRIALMAQKDAGTIAGVLRKLVEKGLVETWGEEGQKRWKIIF